MQVVAWDLALALNRLGIAIAASKAMIATTIMISTRVKPPEPDVRVVFILFFDTA